MRLQEPGRRNVNNQRSSINDGQLNAGWYRVFGQAGNRLLDISDLPEMFIKRELVRKLILTYSQPADKYSKSPIETLDQCIGYEQKFKVKLSINNTTLVFFVSLNISKTLV